MKPEPPDPLLQAVLDRDDGFQENSLSQTLTLARRRRRKRMACAIAIEALIIVIALILHRTNHPPRSRPPLASLDAPPAVSVIRSEPLAAAQVIRSQGALFTRIESEAGKLAVVKSDPPDLARIRTQSSSPMLEYLSDQQLLTAFPGHHPVLIAPGTAEAQLIFY